MLSLIADQLSFGWSPETPLFENLSLAIGAERVGLVGSNGVGKSTLIQLLLGEVQPMSGQVSRPERLLYLSQLDDPAMSMANALGIGARLDALKRVEAGTVSSADFDIIGEEWDIEDRARDALGQLSVPMRSWDDPLSTLSGGQAMRARLARASIERPELLILDEPTNDLDADGQEILYKLVETWDRGLLVVSHDRKLLSIVDRILELSSLGLKSYGGNYEFYRDQKEQERQTAQRKLADAEKQVRSAHRYAQERKERADRRAAHGKRTKTGSLPPVVLGALKRRAQATAGRNDALGTQQVSTAEAQRDKAQQAIDVRDPLQFDMPATGLAQKKRVLSVKDLSVQFEGAAKPALEGISMEIYGPERVAITGPNGSGKSTLLKAINGLLPHKSGEMHLGIERSAFLQQRMIGFEPQTRLVDLFLHQNPAQTPNQARAALAKFGFRSRAAETQLGHLSGGERLRASLAIALMSAEPPQLLMLDEPTNHMDLESIETLERALISYDGALLVTSHDRWFLEAIGIEREIEL